VRLEPGSDGGVVPPRSVSVSLSLSVSLSVSLSLSLSLSVSLSVSLSLSVSVHELPQATATPLSLCFPFSPLNMYQM
jgi:hypothetical protein